MIKYIIFDWSGVLSDDFSMVYKAIMEIFKKLKLEIISFEEFRKIYSLPYINFYKKFIKNPNKEELDKMFITEFKKLGEPKPYPGAKNIMEDLNKRGIKIIILSSHPQEKLEKEVKDYGFRGFISEINGGVHDKVEAIEQIIKRNNFKTEETAYIGDMVHDVEAAKKAKVKSLAVLWGYDTEEKLRPSNPDFIINNFKELEEKIAEI